MGERDKGVADQPQAGRGMRVRAQRPVGNGSNGNHRDSIAQPYESYGSGVVRRGSGDPPRKRKPRKRILFPLAFLLGILLTIGVLYFTSPSGKAGWKVMHQLVTPKKDLRQVFHANQTHVLLLG